MTINWSEYDSAAEYLAKRGLKGVPGDPLPPNLSDAVIQEINKYPREFQERIIACAYALAREPRS